MPDLRKDWTGCDHSWRSIAMPSIERPEGVEPAWCSTCGSLKSIGMVHEPMERVERRNADRGLIEENP